MMAELTPESHKKQTQDYTTEKKHYDTYAKALKRVLEKACKRSIPEAIIQARSKGISSFAEKCVRKYDQYGDDAAHKMTDLCGARVIVHTIEQVKAVRMFIEANFVIIECDDKGLLLGETKFGYRDVHYLVRLLPDRSRVIGFTPAERKKINDRIAEIQIRSIVQHAWADILHDRMYKAPLRLSSEAKRTGALLAAIMEDGDRSFNQLALEIDGMTSNYSAYASRQDVENEIKVQELILNNESDHTKKPAVALILARLEESCGQYKRVIELLEPYAGTKEAIRYALFLELGYALCRVHRNNPASQAYQNGQRFLQKVIEHCTQTDLSIVPNLRKQKSLLAKAYSRLAWSWEVVPDASGKARINYRKALETEPNNPYHLANQLGYEIFCERSNDMIHSMKTTLQHGIKTCREHAIANTELPYALFTAGRLSLLLGQAEEALGWYARGLRHYSDGASCVSETVLTDEIAWIENIHFGLTTIIPEHEWIKRLIALANSFNKKATDKPQDKPKEVPKVLIVAGGAASMKDPILQTVKPILRQALKSFKGIVISGGTKIGIPGAVGDAAASLARQKQKQFELVGYIPKYLPNDAPKDTRYDRFVEVSDDKDFSPGQILRTWEDLLEREYEANHVALLGFGGGSLTTVEYHVALALGAIVGAVQETGGAAETILTDRVWANVTTLLSLPLDKASAQAFTTVPTRVYKDKKLDEMAKALHEKYVELNPRKLPENMRPWDILPDTYKRANREQARYAVEILQAAGFKVRAVRGTPKITITFKKAEIERMAELEHGRWNIERLRDGWRPGKPRDDDKKIHDCLIPWVDVPEEIKHYDYEAVLLYPTILAKAGLKVTR